MNGVLVFSNLTIKADRISPNYTFAFEFLAEWMPKLNSTFELEKIGTIKAKEGASASSHPTLLRLVDAFCNHKIEFSVNLQLLQNFFTDWQLTPSFA